MISMRSQIKTFSVMAKDGPVKNWVRQDKTMVKLHERHIGNSSTGKRKQAKALHEKIHYRPEE